MAALTALAADAADQQAWLAAHRVETDDLALDFEHALRTAATLAAAGRIEADVMARLEAIDARFTNMSGQQNAHRWTPQALATDTGWHEARAQARQILTELTGGWNYPLPDITVIR
ncbi:hypothetical protein BG418_14935 [Streptomyces sp. CBMA152]|nr:hypothetical protein [Streptomyces sp. CBMA152]